MLFLGSFLFDIGDHEKGHFQCLTEALDVEAAMTEFKKIIRKAHSKKSCLSEAEKIFFKHVHRIEQVPSTVLINYVKYPEGNPESCIECATPEGAPGIDSFTENIEGNTWEPFLVFKKRN